jgi:hypothetical protein
MVSRFALERAAIMHDAQARGDSLQADRRPLGRSFPQFLSMIGGEAARKSVSFTAQKRVPPAFRLERTSSRDRRAEVSSRSRSCAEIHASRPAAGSFGLFQFQLWCAAIRESSQSRRKVIRHG